MIKTLEKFHITVFLILFAAAAFSQGAGTIDVFKANINTPADDFYPSLSANGTTLVYASKRGDGKTGNLYISVNVNGQWDSPADLDKLNSPANDITPFISYDGAMIVFSSDRREGEAAGKPVNYDLYVSFKVDNEWIEPVKLSDDINSADNESAPGLSKDNDELYFTRWPDGQPDNSRIYRAVLTDNGFSNAEELPKIINSGHSEFGFAPSRKREGFYFASKKPGGYGSWDLYFVYYKLGSFGNPVNLGPGVNTGKDEIYVTELDDDRIYFSSNRSGGAGNFDLLSAEIPHEFGESTAAVNDKKDDLKKEKETGFKFKISDKKTGKPVSMEFQLKLKGGDGQEDAVKTVVEKSDSAGILNLITEPEVKSVSLKSLSEDYSVISGNYNTERGSIRDINIALSRKKKSGRSADPDDSFYITPPDFKPIYFESNSASLKLEYIPYLYGIVNYLRKNENVKLKIIGHSGLTGSCVRNNKISLNRARRVRDYIKSFGIDRERLIVKGMGDRFPADSKYNEVNRRVEFQVIE